MMCRKISTPFLLVCLILLISCAKNIHSVRTLVEYEESIKIASDTERTYVIRPGDILAINVWKEPELSKDVAVRLDGKVSLPLINDINATGLTCMQFQNHLKKRYADYVEATEVSVTLLQPRSSKIYILGKINQPGEYSLEKKMSFLQAISRAGGPGKWADTSNVRLIRNIHGTDKTFRVDYDAIVSGQDLSQNISLRPNDTIYLP
jgi:polysaccharide export outer membrane protein